MPEAVIELNQVSKRYGSGATAVEALSGLNLSVPRGCLYGLLGPNGAGKTTCLRILSTLLEPDSGTVRVGGLDALAQPRQVRELLGYVAQDVAIDKILSGRELLQLQGDLYHLDRADRDRRIAELSEVLGMVDWLDRRCGTYSGGMRRRLDLAAGLLHRPAVLVLDEPTVGLDIDSRAAIWRVTSVATRRDSCSPLLLAPWASLASASASGRFQYRGEATSPFTVTSPTTPAGRRWLSSQAASGPSLTGITATSRPGTGLPTQVPLPSAQAAAVPCKISSEPMRATGRASVAP